MGVSPRSRRPVPPLSPHPAQPRTKGFVVDERDPVLVVLLDGPAQMEKVRSRVHLVGSHQARIRNGWVDPKIAATAQPRESCQARVRRRSPRRGDPMRRRRRAWWRSRWRHLAIKSLEPSAQGTKDSETRLLEQFPLGGDEVVLLDPGSDRFGEHIP